MRKDNPLRERLAALEHAQWAELSEGRLGLMWPRSPERQEIARLVKEAPARPSPVFDALCSSYTGLVLASLRQERPGWTASHDLTVELRRLEWQQTLHWFEHLLKNFTGDNLKRWRLRSQRNYAELTDKEREDPRKWADRVIQLAVRHGYPA